MKIKILPILIFFENSSGSDPAEKISSDEFFFLLRTPKSILTFWCLYFVVISKENLLELFFDSFKKKFAGVY